MALNLTLRKAFLYIFASVGLVITIFGGVSLINLGLKSWVFTKADNYCYEEMRPVMVKTPAGATPSGELTEEQIKQNKDRCESQRQAQKQGQASNAIAMLLVGLPLYTYHWARIRKENQE
jgi:hypothetical protein